MKEKLSEHFEFDCEPVVKGLSPSALLLHFEDVVKYPLAFDTTGNTILDNIIPQGRAYKIEGIKNHFTGVQKLSGGGFSHEISLRVYVKNSKNFGQIRHLSKGSFIIIVKTNDQSQNGENTFEILGFDAGLTLSGVQYDYNKSNIVLNFSTPPSVREFRLPYKWWLGSFAKTLDAFENTKNTRIFDDTFDRSFE